MPEKPNPQPAPDAWKEQAERVVQRHGLQAFIARLRNSIGDPSQFYDGPMQEKDIQDAWEKMRWGIAKNFSESSKMDAWEFLIAATQHQAKAEKEKNPGKKQRHRLELAYANQKITHLKYLPVLAAESTDVLSRNELDIRALLPFLPEEHRKELQQSLAMMQRYEQELARAIEERTTFANCILLIDAMKEVVESRLPDKVKKEVLADSEKKLHEIARLRGIDGQGLSQKSREAFLLWEALETHRQDPVLWKAFFDEHLGRLKLEEEDVRGLIAFHEQKRAGLLDPRWKKASVAGEVENLQKRLKQIEDERQMLLTWQAGKAWNGLDFDSRRALQYRKRVLDQNVLNILSGLGARHVDDPKRYTVNPGFFPHAVSIDVYQSRYRMLRSLLIDVAENKDMSFENKQKIFKAWEPHKRDALIGILRSYQDLLRYHWELEQLMMFQRQPGTFIDAREPVRDAPDRETESVTVKQMQEFSETEQKFHLRRMRAMVDAADAAANPNSLEAIEDALHMKEGQALEETSKWISDLMRKILVPGVTPGMEELQKKLGEFLDKELPLSLKESMKEDLENELKQIKEKPDALEELKNEARKKKLDPSKDDDLLKMLLLRRLTSLRSVLKQFHGSQPVKDIRATITVLEQMPSPMDMAGALPDEEELERKADQRVTMADLNIVKSLKAKDPDKYRQALATLNMRLKDQMDRDIGTCAEGQRKGSGYLGAYENFLLDIEKMTGVRLDLKAHAKQIRDSWHTLAKLLWTTGAALFIAPAAIAGTAGAVTAGVSFLRAAGAVGLAPSWGAAARSAAGSLPRIGWGLATAAQAVRVYADVRDYLRMEEHLGAERQRMGKDLEFAGFRETEKGSGVYVYRQDDKEIMRITVGSVEDIQKTLKDAQKGVIAVDTAELGVLTWATVARAGLRRVPLIGIAILIGEEYKKDLSREARRNFLHRLPPWLLAMLGSEGIQRYFGATPYELLLEFSRRSPGGDKDVQNSHPSDAEVKRIQKFNADQLAELRSRMLFVMFMEELKPYPALRDGLFANHGHATDIDRFFKGEFRNYVVPLFMLRSSKYSGGIPTVQRPPPPGQWEEPQPQLSKAIQDEGFWFWSSGNPLSFDATRTSLLESAILTQQHERQKRAHEAMRVLRSYAQTPNADTATLETLHVVIDHLTDHQVFGRSMKDFRWDDDSGSTIMERYIQAIINKRNPSRPQRVEADDLGPFGQPIDLDSEYFMQSLIEDPAMAARLAVMRKQALTRKDWKLKISLTTTHPTKYMNEVSQLTLVPVLSQKKEKEMTEREIQLLRDTCEELAKNLNRPSEQYKEMLPQALILHFVDLAIRHVGSERGTEMVNDKKYFSYRAERGVPITIKTKDGSRVQMHPLYFSTTNIPPSEMVIPTYQDVFRQMNMNLPQHFPIAQFAERRGNVILRTQIIGSSLDGADTVIVQQSTVENANERLSASSPPIILSTAEFLGQPGAAKMVQLIQGKWIPPQVLPMTPEEREEQKRRTGSIAAKPEKSGEEINAEYSALRSASDMSVGGPKEVRIAANKIEMKLLQGYRPSHMTEEQRKERIGALAAEIDKLEGKK